MGNAETLASSATDAWCRAEHGTLDLDGDSLKENMAKLPRVSIVMPAYNAAATIARAIGSILTQTVTDLELLVIDDGSTDNTLSVVEHIRDPRLRVICCAHRGVVATANTATQQARAPLIARMDADDFAHPRRIEAQLRLLQRGKFDAVGCQVRILDPSGQPVDSLQRYEHWINAETLASDQISALRFVELPLVNPTILARREYFQLGFRDIELPEDYDLLLRAASQGMRFGKVPEVLLDWFDGPDRLTRNDARYSDAAFMRCRRLHLSEGPLKGVRQVDLWGVGKTGKPWLRWLQADGVTIRRAYDINDKKIGSRIHDVLVMSEHDLPPTDGTPLIIAVGAAGARETITPQIQARGYLAGRDAWFVA